MEISTFAKRGICPRCKYKVTDWVDEYIDYDDESLIIKGHCDNCDLYFVEVYDVKLKCQNIEDGICIKVQEESSFNLTG